MIRCRQVERHSGLKRGSSSFGNGLSVLDDLYASTLATLLDNRYLSLQDTQFVDDVHEDLNFFYGFHDSNRVLLFPALKSYYRLLIHKTVEAHWSELVTFSVGEGSARRTVVAFRIACTRGPRGVQLMSNPTPHESRGRGRGRGKELSSQDRVTNWVNQREARRLNKERWAAREKVNRDMDACSPGEQQLCSNEEKATDNSGPAACRSKPKKQGVALYVPPSLRQKQASAQSKEVEPMASDTLGLSREQETSKDLSTEQCSSEMPSQSATSADTLKSCSSESRGRGRGRGRRKPEMEIYVPRALRGASSVGGKAEQKERSRSKEGKSPSSQRNFGSKQDQNIQEQGVQIPSEDLLCSKKHDSLHSDTSCPPEPSEDKNNSSAPASLSPLSSSFQDSEIKKMKRTFDEHKETATNSSTEAVSSPLLPPEDGMEHKQKGLQIDTSVPLTFEFYDPAVIAFLPSQQKLSPPSEIDSCCNALSSQNAPFDMSNSASLISEMSPEAAEGDNSIFSHEEEVHRKGAFDHDGSHKDGVSDSGIGDFTTGTTVIDQSDALSDNLLSENETEFANQKQEQLKELDISSRAQSEQEELHSQEMDVSPSAPSEQAHSQKDDISSQAPSKQEEPASHSSVSDEASGTESGSLVEKTKTANSFKEDRGHDTMSDETGNNSLPAKSQEEEEDGDTWDALFDDNGDSLDDSVLAELTEYVGKVEIVKPKINYLAYQPKEPELDTNAFSHIIEIYDFSPELATCDLITAFRDFSSRGFDVSWVDDTHALGIFSSVVAANEALRMIHPLFKVRPLSEASKKGQNKARHCQEFLQPYKARPETTSIAARRLVAGALGMAPKVSRELREQERKKLKDAKEKRRQERQQKIDVWDGSVGKCAMDEEAFSTR